MFNELLALIPELLPQLGVAAATLLAIATFSAADRTVPVSEVRTR